MSNPWGRIGSWAAEAEREESEEREQQAAAAAAAAAAPPPPPASAAGNLQSFPSLKEAVSTKPKKKTMSLSEFVTGGPSGRGTGLTRDEMMQLPTGPQQRSPDEYGGGGGRLGGGFAGYGSGYNRSGGGPGRRDGDSDGSWGGRRSQGGGFDDDRRGPSRRDQEFDIQPSRADEADDWGAGKRAMPPPPAMDSGRGSRYATLGGGSRADEVDNWARKPVHSSPPAPAGRPNSFGSGFRDPGFDSGDRWRRGGEEREGDVGGERRRLVLDPRRGEGPVNEQPSQVVHTNKLNPFGAARPREEILAEKGLDWKKLDSEIETKKSVGSSRPTSSHGSRPSSAQSGRSETTGLTLGSEPVAVKTRPKVNPFGDAKPREVVLEEKGKDWRKIDLELENRRLERDETEAEKALKEEIEILKKELEKQPDADPSQEPIADKSSLRDQIQLKERDLEILIKELEDKARLGQKSVERPSSGADRFGSFSDRSTSRPGSVGDGQSLQINDRPNSRGQNDVWTKTREDRRGNFHAGRDRGGFLGARDHESRPAPKGRW